VSTTLTHSETSHDPRTGQPLGDRPDSPPEEVAEALRAAAAAAPDVAAAAPGVRRDWLYAVADAVDARADELVALAEAETALGHPRLTGEVARMAGQLRFYADVAAEGSWLGATLDPATATAPALARVNVPLGPVAVFGASNFPFGFGVLGNDTGSALAAGCPVVVKAHPAHPLLSDLLGTIAGEALTGAGAPAGTFALVHGFEAGTQLVLADEVAAVGFTGSQRAGLHLWRLANGRERVVPVFAEMGTVNPAVVTPDGAADLTSLAAGFVGSFTLGSGQFCTKPGLLLAPRGSGAAEAVAEALAPVGPMLTRTIAASVDSCVDALVAAGASIVARVPGDGAGWSAAATVLRADLADLRPGSPLLDEVFGPVALVVEYDDVATLVDALDALQGALAGSVFGAGPDDADLPAVVDALSHKVGRVAIGDWPTGVAWTWGQQHGGPWPATTDPSATSVGAAALDRFVRPVTWQSAPDTVLPPSLQAGNPWRLPRRVGGVLLAGDAS